MSWIKIRTNLATDPAVSAIGIATKMNPKHVVGCLFAVWCWADPLTADGFIAHATGKLVDEVAGKRGFSDAMAQVGWLCISSDGISFPKWDRHNSQSAKARAGEAERKRISRSLGPKSGHTFEKMSGQMSGQITDQSLDQRRGEERREENTDKETSSPLSSPPAASNDAKDAGPSSNPPVPFVDVVAAYNALCPSLPRAELTPTRRSSIRARWLERVKAGDAQPMDWFRKLFAIAEASDFLSGRKAVAGPWRCSFDWLIGPKNSQKVIEGNYDNKSELLPGLRHGNAF